MPTYLFQCSVCGLQTSLRVSLNAPTAKCSCGAMAERCSPTGVRVAVSSPISGLPDQVTGFSGADHNADRAIGAYSESKWGEIKRRHKDKVDIIRQTNAEGKDLSRTHDGTYRVMTPDERAKSERSREFHFNVLRKAPRPR